MTPKQAMEYLAARELPVVNRITDTYSIIPGKYIRVVVNYDGANYTVYDVLTAPYKKVWSDKQGILWTVDYKFALRLSDQVIRAYRPGDIGDTYETVRSMAVDDFVGRLRSMVGSFSYTADLEQFVQAMVKLNPYEVAQWLLPTVDLRELRKWFAEDRAFHNSMHELEREMLMDNIDHDDEDFGDDHS